MPAFWAAFGPRMPASVFRDRHRDQARGSLRETTIGLAHRRTSKAGPGANRRSVTRADGAPSSAAPRARSLPPDDRSHAKPWRAIAILIPSTGVASIALAARSLENFVPGVTASREGS